MLGEHNEPQINFDSLKDYSESKRHRQLLFALALLLTALGLVVLKNRQFWFDALSLEATSDQTTSDTIKKNERNTSPATSRKGSTKRSLPTGPGAPAVVAPEAEVTVLSPLQVDVTYAWGLHKTLLASNSPVHIDLEHNSQQSFAMPAGTVSGGAGPDSGTTEAGAQVRFSPQTKVVVVRLVDPIYPPLAQQANVQGSVVLLAQIGKEGNVQALQVLSGPAILTTGALEAVKQWRFKPHLEAGQAIPFETRITVNFTISTQ